MTPALRRLNFLGHVTFSVGWLGAVASFLALSVAGLASRDPETLRSAYVAMNLLGEYVIVPLSVIALVTGVVQSLGTHWGLLRYYWVVVKLVLTMLATAVLVMHQFTAVRAAAQRATQSALGTLPDVGRLGVQLAVDSALAVLTLLVVTAIAVYKPWGKTPYGLRSTQAAREGSSHRFPVGLTATLVVLGLALAAFVILHLTGHGLGGHGH